MAGAIYVTGTAAITGSFSKILVVSNVALGLDIAAAKFDDIQFGIGDLANDDGINNHLSPCTLYNDVANLHVTGSTPIEGPITGFKLVNGQVLAYYS